MADIDDARSRGERYDRELEKLEAAAEDGSIVERDCEAIAAFATADSGSPDNVGTIATYVNRLRVSAERAHRPLVDFEETDDVETLLEAHTESGATAASTLNNHLSALRGFFAWLEDTDNHGTGGYGFRTAVSNVSPSGDDSLTGRTDAEMVLSPPEVAQIRTSADHPRETALLTFLVGAGVRVAVACQMRCGDISLGEEPQFRRNPDGLGQSSSSEGTHPLFERQQPLRRWLREYHPEAPDPPDGAPLFPVKRGYDPENREDCALSPSAAADALESAAETAGIDSARVRPRNLRRTAAVRQRAAYDLDWETIRARTGLSDDGIATVERLCERVDIDEEEYRDAASGGPTPVDDGSTGVAAVDDEPASQDDEGTSACVDCGADLPDRGTYCPVCGVDQSAADGADAGHEPERVDGPARSEGAFLDHLGQLIRAVNEVLTSAGDRESILKSVADRLADSELYDEAWSFEETLSVSESASRADAGEGGFEGTDVVEVSLTDGEQSLDGREALPFDVETGVDGHAEDGRWTSVPVVYGRTAYGTLVLFSTRADAFGERELAILDDIGRQVGRAVNAAEKELLLVSDEVTELELAAAGGDPLAEGSRLSGVDFGLQGVVPTDGDDVIVYCAVEGDIHEAVAGLSRAEGIVRIRPINDNTIECRLGEGSLVVPLREVGAQIETLDVEGGVASVTARVSPEADVRAVVERVQQSVPPTELRAKRRREAPADPEGARLDSELSQRLTDRQLETIEAAYSAGYFEWPRESTAEDVADEMGVSSPTVHNHLRKAENEVLGELLDGQR